MPRGLRGPPLRGRARPAAARTVATGTRALAIAAGLFRAPERPVATAIVAREALGAVTLAVALRARALVARSRETLRAFAVFARRPGRIVALGTPLAALRATIVAALRAIAASSPLPALLVAIPPHGPLAAAFGLEAAGIARVLDRLRHRRDDALDLHRPALAIGGLAALDLHTILLAHALVAVGAQRRNVLARPALGALALGLRLLALVAAFVSVAPKPAFRRARRAFAVRPLPRAPVRTVAAAPARGALVTVAGKFALALHRPALVLVARGRLEIGLRLRDQARPQLIAQHARLHFLHSAFGELAQLERAVGHADQPVDVEAERAEHAPHFAVLALAQAKRDPRVRALHAVELRLDRRIGHVVHRHALRQRVEPRLIRLAVRAHAVAAQPARLRQFQRAGEAAVVGHQQQALGVDVEAADRHQARQVGMALAEIIEDRLATLRVVIGRHVAARLVEQEQPRLFARRHRAAVDGDLVGRRHVERRALQHAAVDGDAAGRDPFLGVAARAGAGARHGLGDALALIGLGRARLALRPTLGGAARLAERLFGRAFSSSGLERPAALSFVFLGHGA